MEIRVAQRCQGDDWGMTLFLTEAGFRPASPVGRPTHELALHEALLRAAPFLLPRPKHERVAVQEFTIRGARPDVVVTDADLNVIELRTAANLLPLKATSEIALKAVLRPRHLMHEEDAIEAAARYISPAKARKAIKRLLATGYFIRVKGRLGLDPACEPFLGRTLAFEAKMGNWRAAAAQARRWRLMFDQASLVFPVAYADRVRTSGILSQFGLLAVTRDGAIRVNALPPSRRTDSFNATLTEEAFYSRLLVERAATSTQRDHPTLHLNKLAGLAPI
jgi:hypothetical protein